MPDLCHIISLIYVSWQWPRPTVKSPVYTGTVQVNTDKCTPGWGKVSTYLEDVVPCYSPYLGRHQGSSRWPDPFSTTSQHVCIHITQGEPKLASRLRHFIVLAIHWVNFRIIFNTWYQMQFAGSRCLLNISLLNDPMKCRNNITQMCLAQKQWARHTDGVTNFQLKIFYSSAATAAVNQNKYNRTWMGRVFTLGASSIPWCKQQSWYTTPWVRDELVTAADRTESGLRHDSLPASDPDLHGVHNSFHWTYMLSRTQITSWPAAF